jgi:microcystin-dependent protein
MYAHTHILTALYACARVVTTWCARAASSLHAAQVLQAASAGPTAAATAAGAAVAGGGKGGGGSGKRARGAPRVVADFVLAVLGSVTSQVHDK